MNHSKEYIDRNVASCDLMIAGLDHRISIKDGDVKELRKAKADYKKVRAALLKE